MTDKVQKIREEVERKLDLMQYQVHRKDAYKELKSILDYIDSLQEEPVNVWHDTGEIPKEGALILKEIGISQKGYGVIRYSKEIPNFPKHCEDIPMQRWAYIDDLLKLSNVQRTGKNWKEEPKKCMFTKEEFAGEDRKILCEDCEEDCEYAKKEEPVSKVWHEPIERPDSNKVVLIIVRCGYIGEPRMPHLAKYDSHNNQYIDKDRTDVCNHPIMYHIDSVEKWVYIDDILNLTTKEETVSEDLKEEIRKYLINYKGYPHVMDETEKEMVRVALHFAEWQKQKMMKNAVNGKVVARYPKALPSLYDAINVYIENDTKSLKEGDNVKLIIIKED